MSTIEYTLKDKQRNIRKVVYVVAYYGIATVLLFSGVSKIIDTTSLIEVLQQIKLPHDLVLAIATILPITEIGLGLMLLLKIEQKTALKIAALLFLFFFLFAVYGTVIGLDKDCGCFGRTMTNEFGWMMIIRNALLLLLSIITTTKIEK